MVARKKTTTRTKHRTIGKKKSSTGSGLAKYKRFIDSQPAVKKAKKYVQDSERQLKADKKLLASAKKEAAKKYSKK